MYGYGLLWHIPRAHDDVQTCSRGVIGALNYEMEVSCVKFVRQYKMSHGHHHLQLEHRGVSQIRRVFQFGQLQVCCDNHESAATSAAFNDENICSIAYSVPWMQI